ncbi:MAG TPA: aspartyl protease family protein [Thermoanaerobaculia bacterium]|nr:aspartyl protease family protein [Thermoanaerobaculia bacterium]
MTRTARLAILCTSVLALGALPGDAGPALPRQIPFTTGPRGHLIVEVALNGRGPFHFALDTGASHTVVNRARLGALELVERPSGHTGQGAHETIELGLADVSELELGGIELRSLEVAVMDLSHVEVPGMPLFGVLGFDVFGRWDLELDLASERVVLHPRAETESACAVCSGDLVVPFELVNGTHIRFEIVVSGQPMTALLDTGSGRSGMNRHAVRALGIDLPPAPEGAHGPALKLGEVNLGDGVLARDLVVGVVDLPAFVQLGVSEGPAVLLGTGAFAGKRIGIAYGLHRMSVSAAP